MNRTGAAVVAVVALLAVATSAAMLDSVMEQEDGSSGIEGEGSGGILPNVTRDADTNSVGSLPQWLVVPLVAVGGIAILAYVVTYVRQAANRLLYLAAGVVLMAGLVLLIRQIWEMLRGFGLPSGGSGGFGGSGSTGAGGDVGAVAPPATGLAVLLLGVVGVTVLAVYLAGDDTEHDDLGEPTPAEGDGSDGTAAAVARVAGRAADRIEQRDSTAENEVYRAWKEMTSPLDVPNPRASTPGEFAAAARNAGIDEDDVAELTDLFREVRYGDRTPSEDIEERAVAALRRIEDGYGRR